MARPPHHRRAHSKRSHQEAKDKKAQLAHRVSDTEIAPAAGHGCKVLATASQSNLASGSHRRVLWFHGAVAVVLTGLCALLYAWTADFPMVFDDSVYLKNNPLVQDASSFGYMVDFREFANKPGKMGLEMDLATNFILRPVAYATFHLNFLADGFEPRWYRTFNIVIHAATSLLIYALLCWLLKRSIRGAELPRGSILFVAVTAASLFAVHPLATESVTYIAQRFTSLGTFFYMLALWFHFTANSVVTRAWRWTLRGGAVLATILGMLTKESTFTAPLMAVILDWLVVGTPFKRCVRKAAALLVCLPIIPIQVMLVAWAQNDGVFDLANSINLTNLKDSPWNHWHYAITQLTVVLSYLRRLIWPSGLNLDPDWPLYHSLLQGPVLAALGTITAIIAGSWLLARRYRRDIRFACVFSFILWFFGTIVLSSGLVPLPDLMAEHRSYLPSIGVFTAAACLLDALRTSRLRCFPARAVAPVLAVLCVAALAVTTARRNEVWRTKISLWEDTVGKSPGKYRAWNNLGAAYQDARKYDQAMACLGKSIKIRPDYEIPYLNMAICLNAVNRHQEALDQLNALIKLDPKTRQNLDVQYLYGLAFLGVGQVDKGIKILEETTSAVPNHRPAQVLMGIVYSRIHRPAKALKHWKQAVTIAPASPQLIKMMREAEQSLGPTQRKD